jgi:hypothetical protein
VVTTLLVAAVSYRLIEQPIRQHGVADSISLARRWTAGRIAGRPVLTGAVTALAIFGYVGGVLLARDIVAADDTGADVPPTALTAALDDPAGTPEAAAPEQVTKAATLAPAVPAAPVTDAAPAGTVAPVDAPAAVPTPEMPALAPAPAPAPALPWTTGIGDSVMLGAAPALEARFGPQLVLEATVGFQMVDAPALVQRLADEGRLGDVVLLHLGANGPFPDSTIDEIMAIVGRRPVLLVNVKVPRRWEAEVNDRLAAAAERYPNIEVVDWRTVSESEDGLLWRDGHHLTPAGAERYADLVASYAAGAVHADPPQADRRDRDRERDRAR